MAKIVSFSDYNKKGDNQTKARQTRIAGFLEEMRSAPMEERLLSSDPLEWLDELKTVMKKREYLLGLEFTKNTSLYRQTVVDLEANNIHNLVNIALQMTFEEIQKKPAYSMALFDTIQAKAASFF